MNPDFVFGSVLKGEPPLHASHCRSLHGPSADTAWEGRGPERMRRGLCPRQKHKVVRADSNCARPSASALNTRGAARPRNIKLAADADGLGHVVARATVHAERRRMFLRMFLFTQAEQRAQGCGGMGPGCAQYARGCHGVCGNLQARMPKQSRDGRATERRRRSRVGFDRARAAISEAMGGLDGSARRLCSGSAVHRG